MTTITAAPDPAATYLLVHIDPRGRAGPAGPGLAGPGTVVGLGRGGPGWTLWGWHDGVASAVRLDARGAAPGAPARVARAVAMRVLAEQGLAVTTWNPDYRDTDDDTDDDTADVFTAVVASRPKLERVPHPRGGGDAHVDTDV